MRNSFNVSSVGAVTKENIGSLDAQYVYSVELDKGVLEGLDEEQIVALAEDSKIITIQGNIRRKGLNREDVVKYMKTLGFNVEVKDYELAEAKPVDNKKIKGVIANILGIDIDKVTDAMVEKAKGLTK